MSSPARIAVVVIISSILFVPTYGNVIFFIERKSVEEKLGYLPQKETVSIVALDHKALLSEWIFFKVIIYYGGKTEGERPKHNMEYANMYRFLDTATYVDPYNIDAYYFSQAVFTWELGMVKEVNQLLERGLHYRTWDYYLPFFLGFNNFYFLKDYKAASQYMKQVAVMTGNPLAANLAARYFFESDETEIGISFLKFMIEKTWNEKIRKVLEVRLRALEAIDLLEKGERKFEGLYGRKPMSIEEMTIKGIIHELPVDPYGGKFFLDNKRKIRTTSEFVLGGAHGARNKDRKPQ